MYDLWRRKKEWRGELIKLILFTRERERVEKVWCDSLEQAATCPLSSSGRLLDRRSDQYSWVQLDVRNNEKD